MKPWTSFSIHGDEETLTSEDLQKLVRRSHEIILTVADDKTIHLERNGRDKWTIEDGRETPCPTAYSDCKIIDEIAPHATGIHRSKVRATTPDGEVLLFFKGFTGLKV